MSSPFGPITLIANPGAGRGRNAVLPRLQRQLAARDLAHSTLLTDRRGDAVELARTAVTAGGARFVVAVGGDGTVHEVVNGLVDAETGHAHGDGVVLGVVAGGSGCDFMRTFGLDRAPERLAGHFEGDVVQPIDLGRVRLTGLDGRPRTVVFANIAEAGYGGLVVDRASRLPRTLGKLRYLVAIASAARRLSTVETTVRVDHTEVREPVSNVVIANGQFFGGNLKVAPRALPDDGRFNVQVWRGSAADVFLQMPKLRVGDHLSSPDVREYQSTTVSVEAVEPLVVEADGEVLGTTPAVFDILPRMVRLKI